MEKILKTYRLPLLLALPLLVLVYFATLIFGSYYFSHYGDLKPSTVFEDQYKVKIAEETDATRAARMGMVFLKTDKDDLAYLAFSKAATLDGNWRDAWIWKGYSELKIDKPQDALTSLKNAEKLDPVYAFTYQLLAQTYELLGNTREADAANQKLGYLTENK